MRGSKRSAEDEEPVQQSESPRRQRKSKSGSEHKSAVKLGITAQGEHGVDVYTHLNLEEGEIVEVDLAIRCCAQTVVVQDLTGVDQKQLLKVRHKG